MPSSLPELIAKKFIQRRNVKAIQFDRDTKTLKAGDWFPDNKIDGTKRPNSPHLPHGFKMSHLRAHIAGDHTYGYYLIDDENKCRMFALDIDLEKTGSYVSLPDMASAPSDPNEAEAWAEVNTRVTECCPRDAWHDRRNAQARWWYKMQMKTLGSRFASIITKDLHLPCAVAYSGNKGIHVYGFLGESDAKDCRAAVELTLQLSGEWELARGKNFYRHRNSDPVLGYPSFSIETFPKQDSLNGKDLGNLLRLPLGTNQKNPKDPTFFLDLNGRAGDFRPHPDPIQLLESGDPFQ